MVHATGKSSPDAFRAWIADPGAAVLYAGTAGTDAPLGYAVLCPPDFPAEFVEPGDWELRRIYTLLPAHGTGLGPALIDASIAEARTRGHTRLLLGVHPDNARARRFYERTGFAVIGERSFSVGASRFTDPIYALTL